MNTPQNEPTLFDSRNEPDELKIRVINKSPFSLPAYKTENAAGLDLQANIPKQLTLSCGQRTVIPTGLYLSIPEGYEGQIRPRSGLAAKYGVTVLNSPGTIDADYRGEVGVILINFGIEDFTIHPGDRIAQIVFAKYEKVKLISVDVLDITDRNQNGFGSTGN